LAYVVLEPDSKVPSFCDSCLMWYWNHKLKTLHFTGISWWIWAPVNLLPCADQMQTIWLPPVVLHFGAPDICFVMLHKPFQPHTPEHPSSYGSQKSFTLRTGSILLPNALQLGLSQMMTFSILARHPPSCILTSVHGEVVCVVFAMGPGNPRVVRFLAGCFVWFGSKPRLKLDWLCRGGVVTRPERKPVVFCLGYTRFTVPFYGSCNFRSNTLFQFSSYHAMLST
jgi:hypothetical protein